ncbi:hypothetical protein N7454_007281 [Penicillium verhagenii]|nr:hypothetical protein N7454_007281 [Penicillium verhagenii]
MPEPHPIQGISREDSLFLFHHLFLPPGLPQSSDFNPKNDILLLKAVIDALDGFRVHFHDQELAALTTIHTMFVRLKKTWSSDGNLLERELYEQFESLKKEGDLLPIYVREQNAGVLFTNHENSVHVESFDLSPRNSPVIMTTGRLIRTFPGPAISMDGAVFNDPALQTMIAQTLTKMNYQAAPETKAKVKKAHQTHDEDRDTTHPKMVTEFLMAMLHPLGSSVDTLQIQKHTREEVMWHNSRLPWRRSALWLFIRVLIQLVLLRLSVEGNTVDLYKQFILYFMCSTLRASLEFTGTPSEEIYLMNAKISRRLVKLELPTEPTWFTSALRTLGQATQIIKLRWKSITENGQSGHDELPFTTLKFNEDTQCKFPNLDRSVQCIRNRKSGRLPFITFQPELQLLKTQPSILPTIFHSADDDYLPYNLAVFENWVALNLDAWMDAHQQDQATCSHLSAFIMEYSRATKSCNERNPETSSVMLLTILELWIACDKSAVLANDLLTEYDPCLPVDILQQLLLPFKSHVLRLSRAEEYLRQRHKMVRYRGPGIFSDFGTSNCFSVKYFDQSEEHQLLYKRIEQDAKRDRMCKQQELLQKQGRYRKLVEQADEIGCQYIEVVIDRELDIRESRHSNSCRAHALRSEANSIQIEIHEWPLASNHLKAKSTVFELNPAEPFRDWRDATLFIIIDVLGMKYDRQQDPRSRYSLSTYNGLRSFIVSGGRQQRIGLHSQTKPHERTHRKKKHIVDVSEAEICVNNGLTFQYFDNELGCFLAKFQESLETTRLCTYRLPKESSTLQAFLFRSQNDPNGLSPNAVIASQYQAPVHMALEEYRALAVLPLGLSIQWQNILIELTSPLVDFKKVETEIFLLQVIHQAGPFHPSSPLRQGHLILEDAEFLATFLEGVRRIASRISENWEMIHGLSSLVSLVLKILSLSPCLQVQESCITHLEALRQTAFSWIHTLRVKTSQATDDAQRVLFMSKSVHVALDFWAAYRGQCIWSKTSDKVDYWLTCLSPGRDDAVTILHYNLLTGEFLVDGLPVARLPSDYEDNETYRKLFGQSQLEVMPSSSPEMRFSCQKKYKGYVVHIGKQTKCVNGFSNVHLSVNAARNEDVWEFVPPETFVGYLPDAFVKEYVHCPQNYIAFSTPNREA